MVVSPYFTEDTGSHYFVKGVGCIEGEDGMTGVGLHVDGEGMNHFGASCRFTTTKLVWFSGTVKFCCEWLIKSAGDEAAEIITDADRAAIHSGTGRYIFWMKFVDWDTAHGRPST